VKGGGHSVAGSAVCDGGVMLDMSAMTKVVVDASQRIAVAEPGVLLTQLDAATAEHGLATPLGVVSVTGIAGLTLGGGLGWLNGHYGLACDNLVAVDIVTADGQLLTATAEQNDDLFWAVRGGGGNFGVVVSFTYRLHPVSTVLAGAIVYPAAMAAEALRYYHEVVSLASDELTTAASVWRDDEGAVTASVGVCWSGRVQEGESALRRVREFGPPVADEVRAVPYAAFQGASDEGFPRGRQHYWKASFLKQLTPEVIDIVLDHVGRAPSPYTGVGFQQMTGVASRVEPSATAFAHRAKQYDCLILSQWDDPADSPANIAWTRSLFEAMTPFFESGVYLNNLGDEEQSRAPAAFGDNYERLTRIKAKYDPGNLFRSNANIGTVVS
jgi:FAD/FMN-containing dehydrogenase